MTFWRFLRNQTHRPDPVGDLARDARSDRGWRKPQTKKAWRKHLEEEHACDGALAALDEAWREFRTWSW